MAKRPKPKEKKSSVDMSFLKEPAPNEQVLIKKLKPNLCDQFRGWCIVRARVKEELHKIVNHVYKRAIDADDLPEKADKIMRMVQVAFMNEKPFPPDLRETVAKYLSLEREASILELTFWQDVNEIYNLWLKPRIALRKGFVVVQLPMTAFEMRPTNGQG